MSTNQKVAFITNQKLANEIEVYFRRKNGFTNGQGLCLRRYPSNIIQMTKQLDKSNYNIINCCCMFERTQNKFEFELFLSFSKTL